MRDGGRTGKGGSPAAIFSSYPRITEMYYILDFWKDFELLAEKLTQAASKYPIA